MKTGYEILGHSRNGVTVIYDPIHSHAATHLDDTPQLKGLVAELIEGMDLYGEEVARHCDMGRVVGTCDVVAVTDADDIVYAIRRNRDDDGLVPFTKTSKARPCQDVAIHLIPQSDGTYELVSAWIGTYGDDEPFPGSAYATNNSAEYWKHYAFVWGSQEIAPGTETASYPY